MVEVAKLERGSVGQRVLGVLSHTLRGTHWGSRCDGDAVVGHWEGPQLKVLLGERELVHKALLVHDVRAAD